MGSIFPFLTGCERSGTTLLRAMIDAHPQVAVPDESHFLQALVTRRHVLEAGPTVDIDRLVRLLSASPGFRRWGLDPAEVTGELTGAADLASAVRRIYGLYARGRGKPRYADKTTTYVFAITSIAAVLPEARFVHLIRDGRNVALSLLQQRWGPDTVEDAAVWWRVRVEAARAAGAQLPSTRYREVRFEDLATSPEEELRGITTFAGIPWDATMMQYHTRSSGEILRHMPPRRQLAHANLHRPPCGDLRSWHRELPAPSQLTFEALAGDLLDELGYERRFPSVRVIQCPRERRALLDRRRQRPVA